MTRGSLKSVLLSPFPCVGSDLFGDRARQHDGEPWSFITGASEASVDCSNVL